MATYEGENNDILQIPTTMNNCDAEQPKSVVFSNAALTEADQKQNKNGSEDYCEANSISVQNVPSIPATSQQTVDMQNWQESVSSLSTNSDSSAYESPASSTKSLLSNDDKQHYELLEYQDDILQSLRENECKHRPSARFMERQPYLTPDMRAGVIDWLADITNSYDMQTETLYLATSFIDRVLSCARIKRKEFRLLATGALLIAVKYEEGPIKNVSEFAAMSGYTLADILKSERIILQTLNFELCTATAYVFLNLYATKLHFPDYLKFLATYLSELVLLAYTTILPSVAAAAAVALARFHLKLPIWTKELQEVMSYSLMELKPSLLCLSKLHCVSRKLPERHIYLKYLNAEFMYVSNINPVELDERQIDAFIKALGN